jgi:hypothetical protein
MRAMKDNQSSHDIDLSMKSTFQSDNLKVVIRVRPPLPREMEDELPFRSIVKYINNRC